MCTNLTCTLPMPSDGCLASLPQLIEHYVPDLGELAGCQHCKAHLNLHWQNSCSAAPACPNVLGRCSSPPHSMRYYDDLLTGCPVWPMCATVLQTGCLRLRSPWGRTWNGQTKGLALGGLRRWGACEGGASAELACMRACDSDRLVVLQVAQHFPSSPATPSCRHWQSCIACNPAIYMPPRVTAVVAARTRQSRQAVLLQRCGGSSTTGQRSMFFFLRSGEMAGCFPRTRRMQRKRVHGQPALQAEAVASLCG